MGVTKTATSLVEPLTRREIDILARLAENKSNREIADVETLALSSVKWYVRQIYAKLGVNKRSDALARAKELGLLKTGPDVEQQPEPVRNNLPHQITSFIGREKEIAQVIDLVKESPLVTLVGSGGVGKTRLSLAVAERLLNDFADGLWFIDLAALSDPERIPQEVAAVMDVHEQPDKPLTTTLIDHLHAKTRLLILDNCEHLVKACANLLETLLHACPNLHILVTSRELLGVDGESVFHVPSLSLPEMDGDSLVKVHGVASQEKLSQYDAVQLFVARARTASPGFTLQENNTALVLKVCQRLDGIPLALELAAARLRMMSIEQVALRLDDAFQLLTSGSRTALPHHQTLRALIDWSYNLLSVPEQSFMQRLAVFAGSWPLEAAEMICGDGATLDLLGSLVDKSLVLVNRGVTGIRYRMLDTVRQYANEKLYQTGNNEVLRNKHMDYFLRWVEANESDLRGHNQKVTLDRLEAEMDNLRAALQWSLETDNHSEMRLSSALL